MTKRCFIMIGVSGCGKTTACKKIAKQFGLESYVVFSLDACRLKFLQQSGLAASLQSHQMYAQAFEYANANSKQFNELVNAEWASALKAQTVFVDNTNLTRKSRARWCQEARQKGFTIYGVEVMTPLEVAVERQKTRGDKCVPEEVVRDMYMRQQGVMIGSEVDYLIVIDGTR